MRYFSQSGRTMLETMMVMGIIGILSITGIYMYKNAMNGVRADAIIKDVLLRASQAKGNTDLQRTGNKKLVYTPDYKKATGPDEDKKNSTKGRYGYQYQIIDACTSALDDACPKSRIVYRKPYQYVVIAVTSDGQSITPAVCNELRGKLQVYDTDNPKVIYMDTAKHIDNSVATSGIISDCTQINMPLYFTVRYQ